MERYIETLTEHGIDIPKQTILDLRWVARSGDWWAKVEGRYADVGWLWWDKRTCEWKEATFGPDG